MSSKCKQCGEQIMKTGNYTFKILPAKRIPKKARKLMKNSCTQDLVSSLGATSFQQFLEKRARPTNFIELTCGKCGAMSKMKMLKNQFRPDKDDKPSSDALNTSQKAAAAVSTSNKSKKTKAKGGRDKNAGLTLTWSAGSSCSSSGNKADTQPQPIPSISVTNNRNKKDAVSAFKKKKEMENLKKVLFESKKAKKSGSSLQDFLSAM